MLEQLQNKTKQKLFIWTGVLQRGGLVSLAWVGMASFSLYYRADQTQIILLSKDITHIMRPKARPEDDVKTVSAQGGEIPEADRFTQGNAHAAYLLFTA